MTHRFKATTALAAMVVALGGPVALAQDRGLSYTLYGTPGLVEMPTALSAPDGQLTTTATYLGFGQGRGTVSFQVTPRLSASFRYAGTRGYSLPGTRPLPEDEYYFDRSFDLRYQLLDESDYIPAVAAGLQDFLGNGQFSSEYVVATKTFGDSLRVSAGLGWGRFAGANPLGQPFGERPRRDNGEGGQVAFNQFFRGDVSAFAGLEYAINDDWTLKAEYSPDLYAWEEEIGLLDVDSPYNVGLVYRPIDNVQLQAAYLHGSELAFSATVYLNPADRPFLAGNDAPPVPVAVRDARAAAASWDRAALPEQTLVDRLRRGLATEGIDLDAVDLDDRTARIRYTNTRYRSEAQGMGRVARVLTQLLPASIETFVLEPQQRGIPLSSTTLRRSDLEALENTAGGTQAMLDRAVIGDNPNDVGLSYVLDEDPFDYGVRPYAAIVVFDGPAELVAGLEAYASYDIQPNLVLSGSLRYRLTGVRENDDIRDEPVLPPVRTNADLYRRGGALSVETLQLAYYGRPGPNLYSRVTAGYLERMFGGISTELLWAPVNRPYAIGAELNYVQQRAYDDLLGFEDYRVATGHLSVYYDFENDFHGQVDVGRYLAGDWGGTVSLDREFENGWRIGGYATITDVSAEDFGEGSFDRGLRVTIPFDYFLGQPSRRRATNTLASLTRDGGARLNVDGRLYETVRGGLQGDLEDSWGRFWR